MNDVTEKIEKRLVRYGDLLPCKTAFIAVSYTHLTLPTKA